MVRPKSSLEFVRDRDRRLLNQYASQGTPPVLSLITKDGREPELLQRFSAEWLPPERNCGKDRRSPARFNPFWSRRLRIRGGVPTPPLRSGTKTGITPGWSALAFLDRFGVAGISLHPLEKIAGLGGTNCYDVLR